MDAEGPEKEFVHLQCRLQSRLVAFDIYPGDRRGILQEVRNHPGAAEHLGNISSVCVRPRGTHHRLVGILVLYLWFGRGNVPGRRIQHLPVLWPAMGTPPETETNACV